MRTLAVIAPSGHTFRRYRYLQLLRGRASPDFVLMMVSGLDELPAVSRRCREGFDRVLAMGGDGTVAAVAQAVEGLSIPMGILPAGTGNWVARELAIPIHPEKAFRIATDPETPVHLLDAMRIRGHLFLLNAGVGVNAAATDGTSRLEKSLFGRAAYVGTAIRKVIESNKINLVLTVDGISSSFSATDVLISNCGGLARVLHPNAPDVRPDDGWLDVCVASLRVPADYPWYYIRRWLFPEKRSRIVQEMRAGQTISVQTPEPVPVQADGDIIGTTPVTIELVPKAVSILAP